MKNVVPPRPRRVSRGERRVTYALKVLLTILVAAVILAGILAFLGRVRSVTIILVGAIFFTYIISPAVRRLHRRLPLVWSIVLVYVAIALIAGFGIAIVVPALISDTQSLTRAYPTIIHNAQVFVGDPNNPIVARLPQSARDYLTGVPAQIGSLAGQYAGAAASHALTFLLSAVSVVATVVVIPIISIYLMIEAPGMLGGLLNAVPPRARPKTLAVLHDLDAVLGGFIRGQFLVGAVIGTCITIVLLIFHVRYGVLIGVAAGLLDIIPYVGAIVAFLPATLISLFTDGWQHALIIAGLFILIFQLEGHFIAPRIVSSSVGLSPLTVIVAILIGAELGGIGGMFLAVPVSGMLRVLVRHAIPNYGAAARTAA